MPPLNKQTNAVLQTLLASEALHKKPAPFARTRAVPERNTRDDLKLAIYEYSQVTGLVGEELLERIKSELSS